MRNESMPEMLTSIQIAVDGAHLALEGLLVGPDPSLSGEKLEQLKGTLMHISEVINAYQARQPTLIRSTREPPEDAVV